MHAFALVVSECAVPIYARERARRGAHTHKHAERPKTCTQCLAEPNEDLGGIIIITIAPSPRHIQHPHRHHHQHIQHPHNGAKTMMEEDAEEWAE